MTSLRLAVIPGDGIGPEVTAEALKVLEVAAPAELKLEQTSYVLGAERYLATGEVLPDSVLAEIREHDAILLGAVGGKPNDPNLPPGLLERGLLLRLRFELDHYVNLRPSRIFPGVTSPLSNPGEVDFVVVREGTEGPYTGNGGALRVGTPQEIATEVSVNTAYGVERVVRDAFARAQRRPRKKLTLVHKTNVLVNAGSLWWRLVQAVAPEFPDVTVDYIHVDAAMIFLTTDPSRFDVIVTDNLFGDIITDLAAAITGGIGLAASGNINPDRTTPSMFEPVHGSAPDIAGQQKADPTAAILSASLLLDHLGYADAAADVERAAVADLSDRTAGAARRTAEVGDAIAARVHQVSGPPAPRSRRAPAPARTRTRPPESSQSRRALRCRTPRPPAPGSGPASPPGSTSCTKLVGPAGAGLGVGELQGHQHVLPGVPVHQQQCRRGRLLGQPRPEHDLHPGVGPREQVRASPGVIPGRTSSDPRVRSQVPGVGAGPVLELAPPRAAQVQLRGRTDARCPPSPPRAPGGSRRSGRGTSPWCRAARRPRPWRRRPVRRRPRSRRRPHRSPGTDKERFGPRRPAASSRPHRALTARGRSVTEAPSKKPFTSYTVLVHHLRSIKTVYVPTQRRWP